MREKFYKLVKEIYSLELRKADNIRITFVDGQQVSGSIQAIRYADKGFGKDNKENHYMKLEYKKADGEIYVANIDRVQRVQLVVRNKRAKKLLTDNCKLLNERMKMKYFD